MKVDFYLHDLTSENAQKIAAVLETPFLTSGSVGRSVEHQLRDYFSVDHACLTNSWTNGALAALLAIDLKPGDEVIVPAMTFVATANAAELLGAKVVFVDVEPGSLLLTPEIVNAALSSRTRAVIPVHLYGQMCDMEGLRDALSERPDVWLLEDAAHCFEGSREGYRPGRHSDAAIFSFYATKNVTCGEGGAVISNNTSFFEQFLKTRLHGMSLPAIDRFRDGEYRHWDMEILGCKANLPDLLAALLPEQIETVDQRLPRRQTIAQRYRAAFADGPLELHRVHAACVGAEHLFPIHVPETCRDEAIAILNAAGIGCTVNYQAVHATHYYSRKYGLAPETLPVSWRWGQGTLSLPLYQRLSTEAQEHVISVVQDQIYSLCGDT
jgi:dTDP-4-amino-4,6-dideoxygalactose transaminase